MKQFKCYRLNTTYTAAEVANLFPLSFIDLALASVGEEIVDRDGDRWVRLTDSDAEQIRVEHLPGETVVYVPADRLERIATAVTEGMVNTIRNEDDYQRIRALAADRGMSVSQWIACDAVKQAHALIAELDKQA